jgi:2-dehydro-3-deoxyphosphogluconate aldolase/(4S)-4-hydroxy-2-oxoglutarate aldolase
MVRLFNYMVQHSTTRNTFGSSFLSASRAQLILPVLRSTDEDAAVRRVSDLVAAGCRVVELTATIPNWQRALARAVHETGGEVLVGMGTIRDASAARSAIEGGAGFLVSPHLVPDVVGVAEAAGVELLQGGLTPTELAVAARTGPVKLFPAGLGGPDYLAAVRDVFPDVAIIPSGGIEPSEVESYLAAGAHAVGVGSQLPTRRGALAALFAEAGVA